MSGIDGVIVWGRGKTGRGDLNEIVKKGGREGLGDWKGGGGREKGDMRRERVREGRKKGGKQGEGVRR